jgi:5,5'-dehydrodivanillate O-demethylase
MADLAEPWTDFVHTGPGTLAGRYMRMFWQPICVGVDLPRGKARPIRILGESFTLYRGESGEAHLVGFRCAHRRTQMSIGWVEGETIRCRYHGWTYDQNGQCVEQPGEPEPFCERIRIPGYPTREYLGLIFAYLGEGEPPPLPRYPAFEGDGHLWAWSQLHGCNFFTAIDNDPIHSPFTHRRPGWDWRDWGGTPPTVWGEERDYGAEVFVRRPGGGAVDSVLHGMPNIGLRPLRRESADVGPTDHLQWRVPRDDESHIVFSAYLIHMSPQEIAEARRRGDLLNPGELDSPWPEALRILSGEVNLDETGLPPGMRITQLQDEAVQIGQEPIPDRSQEHLGRSDTSVTFFRGLWMRELRHLAEGRPIKRWTAPAFARPVPAEEPPEPARPVPSPPGGAPLAPSPPGRGLG